MKLDYYSRNVLSLPAYLGQLDKLKALHKEGADINHAAFKMGNHTPLHFACYGYASYETAEWLVNHGAKLSALDSEGRQPLHLAANAGNVGVLMYLLSLKEAEAQVNTPDANGRTPLHALCIPGSDKSDRESLIVSALALLQKGGEDSLTIKDKQGYTPAMLAVRFGYDFLLDVLSPEGEVPSVDAVDLSTVDYFGRTQLHESAFINQLAACQQMLQFNADPNTENPQMANRTPFHYACAGLSGPEVVQAFLKLSRLDVQKTDSFGATALHFAANAGRNDVLRVLLNHQGLQGLINQSDSEGLTPLHVACMAGSRLSQRQEAIKTLIQYGADVSLKDDKGRTPKMVAEAFGYPELLESLDYQHQELSSKTLESRDLIFSQLKTRSPKLSEVLASDTSHLTYSTRIHYKSARV